MKAGDGQCLRTSDPASEQVLDSLAMVGRHTPVPLLEALLRWRESESPKGANDASTFQRKLAVECIFCSACVRFVECCPQGLTEKLWIGLENFVFDGLINADSIASSEALSIINGMRYLSLGVKTEGGLNASASFVAKANPLNRAPQA